MRILALVLLAGCLDSTANYCGGGLVCPDDQVCRHVTDPDAELCVDQDQLDACVGKDEYAHCGANARCYDHVCLPVACGNSRIDRADPNEPGDLGEVCDDGNERSGDGCSSDCTSNETCGNGVVDVGKEACDNGNLLSHDGCDSACQRETARWNELGSHESTIAGHGAAFDLARDRIVMFGGQFATEQMDEVWEGTAAGLSRINVDARPVARIGAAVTYDAARRTMLVFGGNPVRSSILGDTWLWDGASWAQYAAESPESRSGAAIAYDLERKVAVMFGGRLGGDISLDGGDTWEWDGAWHVITPATKPIQRSGAAMAYDAKRGVIVMFGGETGDRAVWEYDATIHDWHEVDPMGAKPVPRANAAMAFDPTSGKVLLVGGVSVGKVVQDAWFWDGTSWTPATLPDPPVGAGVVAVTDARRGRIEMIGATTDNSSDPNFNQFGIWTWDGTAWSWVEQGSLPDSSMWRCTLDPLRGREVALTNDGVTETDGSSWTKAVPNPAGEVVYSALAYDPMRRVSLVFGGTLANASVDRTWTWDGTAWTELEPETRPPPRSEGNLAFDAKTGRIVLFGGTSCIGQPCDALDDTWEWDGTTWTLANPLHRPPGRGRAAFAYDPVRQNIVMFSGSGLGDTWLWDGSDWIEQAATGPSPRRNATLAWDPSRQRLVLYGGTSDARYANYDVWEWTGVAWEPHPVASTPARTLQVAAQGLEGAGIFTAAGYDSPGTPAPTNEVLRWDGAAPRESCHANIDADGDGLAGCADPDCWWACNPLCPPGAPCDPAAPHCGDGMCDPIEDGWICPADCSRTPVCGDAICDPGEDCDGDC